MNTRSNSPTVVSFGDDVLDRMVSAVEKVRERLLRATGALDSAGIPYAVIGGNAVAAWVSRVDPGAVRNTANVDLLVARTDFERIIAVLESVGFVHCYELERDMFLDGAEGRPRDAIRVFFAGEKIRKEYPESTPNLSFSTLHETYNVLGLESLVRMKLTSFRIIDRAHLRDMIDVGLLNCSWVEKLPKELAARLQELLDNPDG
jgi:hypothetical protein